MSVTTYQTQAITTRESALGRLELARELFQKFRTQCFCHSPRELEITEELVAFVVKGLSTHGGRLGFTLAGKLLPTYFVTFFQVASVCWRLAGRSRSADFAPTLDDWAEFGLSRFSASRGLDELERAGLASVIRKPGRSPVVTIVEAAPNG